MRTHGEIAEVLFMKKGYNIYNLAIEYSLRDGENTKRVYVNSMLELKDEITNFKWENSHE